MPKSGFPCRLPENQREQYERGAEMAKKRRVKPWMIPELRERLSQPEEFVKTTGRLISITELKKRWPGATDRDILYEEETGRLQTFWREKSVRLPSGEVEIWLERGELSFEYEGDERVIEDTKGLFFEENIIAIEKERPDFFYTLVTEEEDAPRRDIPLEEIRKELGLSKYQFLDFVLNTDQGRLITSGEQEIRDYIEDEDYQGAAQVPFFSIGALDWLTVEPEDYASWKKHVYDKGKIENFLTPADKDRSDVVEYALLRAAHLQMDFHAEREKNVALEEELKMARQEIQDLKERLSSNRSELLPTNIRTVIRLLEEGKTDEEIAIALWRKRSGMSQAQVKALLWRGVEFPAEQSLKNGMKELFPPNE